jgi:hypothetical protein
MGLGDRPAFSGGLHHGAHTPSQGGGLEPNQEPSSASVCVGFFEEVPHLVDFEDNCLPTGDGCFSVVGGAPLAPPARCHQTGLRAVRTTLFGPRLAPCAGLALGGEARAWGFHGDRGLMDDGAVGRAPLHQLSSGLEPGGLVSPPRESDAVRGAHYAAGPPWRNHHPGGGRYPGMPLRTEDDCERLLPGCHALVEDIRHPLFRSEMGVHDAVGARALELAGMNVTVSHCAELACREAQPTPAQAQHRWDLADDAAGPPLAAGRATGLGRRWRLCRRVADAGMCQKPRAHGVTIALGRRTVSPPSPPAQGPSRSQTDQGEVPEDLSRVADREGTPHPRGQRPGLRGVRWRN